MTRQHLHISTLLQDLGFPADEKLYWGKRLVRSLVQPGSFKSHSVVASWTRPDLIRIDVRAGLSGKQLAGKDLAQYPLQLQSETFFELDVTTNQETDEDGDTQKGSKGKSSGGGKSFKKSRDNDRLSGHFSSKHDEEIPTQARLSRGVVMGMEIGRDALQNVFTIFCEQVKHAKVAATELLASAGKAITRYTPPPFMAPRGDEDKVYKYDRSKNEIMFGVVPT